ncbi:hypothetical protein GCM10018965_034090 [Nonomuraea roseola]
MDDLQPRLARALLWTMLGLLWGVRLIGALTEGVAWPDIARMAVVQALMLAVLVAAWRSVPYWLVAAQVALCYVAFLVFGHAFAPSLWIGAATVLLALPPRFGRPLAALMAVSGGLIGLAAGAGPLIALWYVAVTVDNGLVVFGLASLAATVERLHAARDDLAVQALAAERDRVHRDLGRRLHDDLTAIGFLVRNADLDGAVELARRTLSVVRAPVREGADAPVPVESPRAARLVLAVVLSVYAFITELNLLAYARLSPPLLVVTGTALVVIVVLHLRPPTGRTLAVLVVLMAALAPFSPEWWVGMAGFLAGRILLTVRPPRSWALAAVFLAAQVPPIALTYGDLPIVLYAVFGTIAVALFVYGLSRLSGLIAALEAARRELARNAVARERDRLARDLHDVLGFSLSAVVLRGELAARLKDSDPDRAAAQAAALTPLVERARLELASVTGDQVRLSLEEELPTLLATLALVGVRAEVTVAPAPSAPEVDSVVATALREGVTNVLRHSRARHCEIEITSTPGRVRLRVANDGVAAGGERAEGSARSGSGLAGLAERARGGLRAGVDERGWFELVAEFPTAPSQPAGLRGDADGVDPVAGAQLHDGRGEVVANRAVAQEQPFGDLGRLRPRGRHP